MIEYVNVQLSVWGRWALRRSTTGLGYPRVCPMFRTMRSGGGYQSCEPLGMEDYVEDTDRAVQRLEARDRLLCVEFYQRGGTAVAVAQRLGVSRQRLYERLDTVHRMVLGHLNDIAAGV